MNKKETIQKMLDLHLPLIKLGYQSKIPVSKNWQKGNKIIVNANIAGDNNIGVLCGARIEERYLLVVDEDPRNGGCLKEFKKEIGLDFWDETLTVRTGGGGRHIYYLTDEPFRCSKPFKGIDIKAEGGYVVAPPSIHDKTKIEYKFIGDCEYIEVAPKALTDYLNKKKLEIRNNTSAQIKIIEQGGRNNFLTSMAGKYKRTGIEGDVLKTLLYAFDLKYCKPPLQNSTPQEIDNIVRSSEKWETVDIGEIKYKEVTKKTQITKSSDFNYHLASSKGLINSIAVDILNSSIRRYPQFAIASALSVVSACAQGSYLAPDLYDENSDGGNLSLYQICTAPAAAGKNHYLQSVKNYINKVQPALEAGQHGSHGGMLTDFFAYNSKISIIDEIQDYFSEISDKRNSHKSQILTTIKELYNGLSVIKNQITKATIFPDINYPYYSIFAVGTPSGMNFHLNGNAVSGGLISRFVLWQHLEVTDATPSVKINIKKRDIELLQEIFKIGHSIGFDIDHRSMLKVITDYCSGRNKKNSESVVHHEAVRAEYKLKYDSDSNGFMLDYRRAKNNAYLKLANSGGAASELSHGSLVDRSFQIAVKIACLHCLGRKSQELNLHDVEWATCLVDENLISTIQNIKDNAIYDTNALKIIDALKRSDKPMTLRELKSKVFIRKADELHKAIYDCVTTHDNVTLLINSEKEYLIDEAFIKKYKGRIPRNSSIVYKN